jgi:hypothetical protein
MHINMFKYFVVWSTQNDKRVDLNMYIFKSTYFIDFIIFVIYISGYKNMTNLWFE